MTKRENRAYATCIGSVLLYVRERAVRNLNAAIERRWYKKRMQKTASSFLIVNLNGGNHLVIQIDFCVWIVSMGFDNSTEICGSVGCFLVSDS